MHVFYHSNLEVMPIRLLIHDRWRFYDGKTGEERVLRNIWLVGYCRRLALLDGRYGVVMVSLEFL